MKRILSPRSVVLAFGALLSTQLPLAHATLHELQPHLRGEQSHAAMEEDQFVQLSILRTSNSGQLDIAFTGTGFFIAGPLDTQFLEYDTEFQLIARREVRDIEDRIVGMTFVPPRGTLFASGTDTNTIYEIDFDGNVLSTFPSIDPANALTYSANSNTLYAANSEGVINEFSLDGELLREGRIPQPINGAAFDDERDTLLVLRFPDDQLLEYSRDFELLDAPFDVDLVPGLGFGLAYESATGRLWGTSNTQSLVAEFGRQSDFAGVGGFLEEAVPSQAFCQNRATGQTVIADATGSGWDCSAAGLVSDPGDRILQNAFARARCNSQLCEVGGGVRGVVGQITICRNLNSGAMVQAPIVDGTWNCEEAGLLVGRDDVVLQVIISEAN